MNLVFAITIILLVAWGLIIGPTIFFTTLSNDYPNKHQIRFLFLVCGPIVWIIYPCITFYEKLGRIKDDDDDE